MTCRACYLEDLTEDERQRAISELPTGTIHLCPGHEDSMKALMPSHLLDSLRHFRPQGFRSQYGTFEFKREAS